MIKGAFTIVTIAGVPVRVHWTFLILLAWVFGAGVFGKGGSLQEGLAGLALVATIFVCVVAHEFGHILAARAFGVRTRDVTLLPIGGVASLERMPDRPWQELVVAIAGPLVNVVIAVVLLPLAVKLGGLAHLEELADVPMNGRSFLVSIAVINVWLVVFNMIPAFPMDGGRVLRALLAMGGDRARATRVAAIVGQVIAVGMAVIGVFWNPMLLVLALFVFLGAGAEAASAEAQQVLKGLRASDVMVRSFRVLRESDALSTAVEELLANAQTDFPVTRDGTDRLPVVGLLTRVDLIRALSERGPTAMVGEAMRAPCAGVHASVPAHEACAGLSGGACPLVPVVEGDRLVGILTSENVSEVILVRNALERRAEARAAGRAEGV